MSEVDPLRAAIKLYVKGDDDTIEHLLIIGFSSYTNNPLNIGLMAPTSEGKTWPITQVMKYFPNAITFSGQSPRALFYQHGELIDAESKEPIQVRVDDLRARLDEFEGQKGYAKQRGAIKSELRDLVEHAAVRVGLSGRILVFLDSPPAELWEALKPLLSHDKWESWYWTVGKKGGKDNKTQQILLVGWPAAIFASAKNEDTWQIWPEIASRFVIISPNTNDEKYREANELTAQLRGLPSVMLRKIIPETAESAAKDEFARVRQDIETVALLGGSEGEGSPRDNFVYNAFAEGLAEYFPHETGVRMRQFSTLLAYVNMSALERAENRPQLVIDGKVSGVVALKPDLDHALRLLGNYFNPKTMTPRKLEFYYKVLLPCSESKKVRPSARLMDSSNQQVLGERTLNPVGTQPQPPITMNEMVEYAKTHWNGIGSDSLRKYVLPVLEEAGYVKREVDSNDRRGFVFTPLEMGMADYRRMSVNFTLESMSHILEKLVAAGGRLRLQNLQEVGEPRPMAETILEIPPLESQIASDSLGVHESIESDRLPDDKEANSQFAFLTSPPTSVNHETEGRRKIDGEVTQ
jgi:hypothetical protein